MTSRNELQVTSGVTQRALPWVIGAVTYLGMLALLGLGAALELKKNWMALLAGRVTVVVPVNVDLDNANVDLIPVAEPDTIVETLRNIKGIDTAEILPAQVAQQLVQPWLGQAATLETLPLPVLIELTLDNQNQETLEAVRSAAQTLSPDIRVDDHQKWRKQLINLASTVAMVASAVVVLVVVIAVILVVLSVRTALINNYATFEILNLMGYPDDALLSHYSRWAKNTGQHGAAFAFLLLVLSVLVLWVNKIVAWPQLLGWVSQYPIPLFLPFVAPLVVLMMVLFTTRLTVRRWLRKVL